MYVFYITYVYEKEPNSVPTKFFIQTFKYHHVMTKVDRYSGKLADG